MPEEMFIYDTDCTDAPLFDRGYTGHEHLYAFGLINMNGRVYDPLMSSFLSPDNYVQCPDNPQNFNRYAYCLNNPLRYTDPSGEVFTELLIAAAIGAVVNLSVQGL
ncbi:MAG: RHS repeat-associated core domain-containing protein, partial [Bacteroidales bacterium]|nr:RHS repeat-associated core domain-containing protein [Bacteroidales bacterium]